MPTGQDLIIEAKRHLGDDYYWKQRPDGSTLLADYDDPQYGSSATEGWDCAELVTYCVYQAYGLQLGLTMPNEDINTFPNEAWSRAWYTDANDPNLMERVTFEQARFTTGAILVAPPDTKKFGHVAISLGDGRIIHATADEAQFDTFNNLKTGVDLGGVKISDFDAHINNSYHAALINGINYWDRLDLLSNTLVRDLGQIDRSGDKDYFILNVEANQDYAIKISGKNSEKIGSLTDPIFNIYTEDGAKLTNWDQTDFSGHREWRYWSPPEETEYMLKVGAGGDNYETDVGSYEVSVRVIKNEFVGKDIYVSPGAVIQNSLDLFDFKGQPAHAEWDYYVLWDNGTGGGFFEADGDRLPARHFLLIGEKELETPDSAQSSDIFLSVTAVGDDWSELRRVEDLDYVAPSEAGYENVFAVYYDPETGWDDWVQSNVIVSDDLIA